MRGYVAQRRNRFYAVIYEGIDPITGRERRRWHPAGTDREQAKELATALAAAQSQRIDGRRVGPTFGAYLTMKWLPAKQLTLRPSTWDGYRRLIELHVLPHLGCVPLRHLRAEHLDRLYATLLERGRCNGAGGLDIKTVHEIHIVIRRALAMPRSEDPSFAIRRRSLMHQSVGRLPPASFEPGMQFNWANFSIWPTAAPTSLPCGWPPTRECAEAKSSGCAGATWISMRPGCR